jgi:PIN domain nuclease of toxin-antitoxin system
MILLDTHAFIWLASDPAQLSKPSIELIRSGKPLATSVVTSWEIALLAKRGRLKLPLPANDYIERAISHHKIRELPLARSTVLQAVGLPEIHRDPFDRILIAEALQSGAPLISKDETIAQYPDIQVVW